MWFSKSSNFDSFWITHFLANRCQIELEVAWLLILIASSLYLHVKFLWPGLQLTFQFNVFVNTEYPNKIHCEKQDKSQRTWPDHDDNHTQQVPAKSTEWQQATIVQNSGILVEDGRRQNSPDSTTEMNCAKTKEREGDYEIFYHKYRFHWFSLMRSSAKNWAVKSIRNVALAMTRLKKVTRRPHLLALFCFMLHPLNPCYKVLTLGI